VRFLRIVVILGEPRGDAGPTPDPEGDDIPVARRSSGLGPPLESLRRSGSANGDPLGYISLRAPGERGDSAAAAAADTADDPGEHGYSASWVTMGIESGMPRTVSLWRSDRRLAAATPGGVFRSPLSGERGEPLPPQPLLSGDGTCLQTG
jgi:hypothetical protein